MCKSKRVTYQKPVLLSSPYAVASPCLHNYVRCLTLLSVGVARLYDPAGITMCSTARRSAKPTNIKNQRMRY